MEAFRLLAWEMDSVWSIRRNHFPLEEEEGGGHPAILLGAAATRHPPSAVDKVEPSP